MKALSALGADRKNADGFLPGPLSPLGDSAVEVDNLIRFVQHPVRAFLRQRLGISLYSSLAELEDGLPVDLDGLAQWQIGQRLLEARLAGSSCDEAVAAELARGDLPPGQLGQPMIDQISDIVEDLLHEIDALPQLEGSPESLDIRARLSDGRLLSGTIPGVRGDVLRTPTYSRVSPKQRLVAWVHFLALAVAYPDREFETVLIGRARGEKKSGNRVTITRFPPLEADSRVNFAQTQLKVLVDLYDRGMREPLPMACEASAAYAQARAAGRNPEHAAQRAWESSWNFDKEDKNEEHRLVWGGVRSFDEFLQEAPRADESGEGWSDSEDSRFGTYAERLWRGPLSHEVIEDK